MGSIFADVGVTRRSVTNVFIAVFSVFIAATLVLVVLTMRWAIRRDRERRAQTGQPEKTALTGCATSPGVPSGCCGRCRRWHARSPQVERSGPRRPASGRGRPPGRRRVGRSGRAVVNPASRRTAGSGASADCAGPGPSRRRRPSLDSTGVDQVKRAFVRAHSVVSVGVGQFMVSLIRPDYGAAGGQ